MVKFNKIKLHNLGQAELSQREESLLRGGDTWMPCLCVIHCQCLYAGDQEGEDDDYYGGSSQAVSDAANQRSDMGAGLTNE